jgi:hypothetical protein
MQKLGFLWEILERNNAFAHATYIPSRDSPADSLSRIVSRSKVSLLETEGRLDNNVFKEVCREFRFSPTIGWFASGDNTQLESFCSFEFDPLAECTDAFLQGWSRERGYVFPPFCLISRVLQKIQAEKPQVSVLIHPEWKSQPWWPELERLRTRFIQLPPTSNCLRLPEFPNLRHRLRKLVLQASFIFFPQS